MDVFGGAPRFVAYPRTFTVPDGADAVLKCQIAGEPRPTVVWERDKSPIRPSARYSLLEDGRGIYQLVVSEARMEDSGQYICKAKNAVGETYAAATLRVEEGSGGEGGDPSNAKPTFLVRPSSARVSRGDDVVFMGRLDGNPPPAVTWDKDGRALGQIFESGHYSVGQEEGEGWHHLKIFGARPPDAGVYLCRAANVYGQSMAAAVLLVDPGQIQPPPPPPPTTTKTLPPTPETPDVPESQEERTRPAGRREKTPRRPKVKVKAFAVRQGKHAKFRCRVTGKPKPEIYWRKDGALVAAGRRHLLYEDREGYFNLKMLYCKEADGGLYTCAASNAAGHTLSSVLLHITEPETKFRSHLQDVEVREREQAVLECEVPAGSVPSAWYLEDRRLRPSDKYVIEQRGAIRRLTIKDVTMDDDGIYLCQMREGGRSVAEVAVKGKIVKRLPRKLSVVEGENAAFCVDLDEEDVDVRWYKDGELLCETHKTIIKSFGKTHVLVLVNASAEDSGIITFVISESKSTSQLKVKGRSRSVPGPPVKARLGCERVNAAWLEWGPPALAEGEGTAGATGYVVERQEVGAEEWLQCLTTQTCAPVQVLGDSVPAEAQYRFRVCSVNAYGRGGATLFPGTVHLVPAARIRHHLDDVCVTEGDEAEFAVELTAPVLGTWHMRGRQIQDDERFAVRHAQCRHSLLIRRSALPDDQAQVTFIAHGVRDSALLYVKAAPATVWPAPDTQRELQVSVPDTIELHCRVSNPDARVHWCKDGRELHPSERLTLETSGQTRKLVVQSSQTSDSGQYACRTANSVVTFWVTVSEPPVRIVNAADDTRAEYQTCDRIVLSCELSRPDAQVTWYKDGLEVEGDGNVATASRGAHRSLIVQSARAEDSGEYVCDAGDDSIFFDITVKDPRVTLRGGEPEARTQYQSGDSVELSCEVSHSGAEVKWSKDGRGVDEVPGVEVRDEGAHSRLLIPRCSPKHSGVYACRTTGDSLSFTIAVAEPPARITRPTQRATELRYLTSEDILLECEVSRADAVAKWYKDGEKVDESGRTSGGSAGSVRTLAVTRAGPADSGEYLCNVGDDSVVFRVLVEDPPVTIVGSNRISEVQSFAESETIAMTCELSHPDVQVRWYRDGVELLDGEKTRIEARGLTRELMVFDSEPSDSGEYVCDAGNNARLTFKVTVTEAPVVFTNKGKLPEEVEASEGGKAVLAAIVSKEGADVAWYRHKEAVARSDKRRLRNESRVHSLTLTDVQKEDSGLYLCRSAHDQMMFNVTVTELPLLFVLRLADVSVQSGGAVTLWCELTKAKGDVVWLKDGGEVRPGRGRVIRAEGRLRSLTLTQAALEDQGEYTCASKDDSTAARVTVSVARVVEFVTDVQSVTVLEGDTAKFTCVVAPEDVRLVWRVDDVEVQPDDNEYLASHNGLCHTLLVRACRAGHGAKVVAEAEGVFSTAILRVQEAQMLFTKKLSSLVVEELQEARFQVEVSCETAEVRWMRQGVVVQAADGLLLQRDGRVRALTIAAATGADRGTYRCETLHDWTQAKLSVEPRRVSLRKALVDVDAVEQEAATFLVELSHPDVEGQWIKDGVRVKPCASRRVSVAGRVHGLTLSPLTLDDTGTIAFQTDGIRCSARLTVREPPVTFVKPLQDLRVPETTVVTLECELSRPNAPARWYKNDWELKPGQSVRIYSLGKKRVVQLGRCGLEESGIYTCDVGDSKTSAKLEVYEREIVITKPLEDVEVRENGNAVFVCEVSHEGVKSEWWKNGEKVNSNNCVKIRQEGNKHFLLICGVRDEDAGQIRFTAKDVECTANLHVEELPVKIVKPLRDKTALEKHRVILECTVSKPRAQVRWFRGGQELEAGDKYQISSEDCYRKLVIHGITLQDEDTYTCDAFEDRSSARVLVEEQAILVVRELQDVEVTAPGEARLECELSVQVMRAPQWSLDGQLLARGPGVRMESTGTVQRLVLTDTSPAMSGLVKFTAGKARSSAQLTVKAE